MARLVLCLLALCATGAFADPRENWSKVDPDVLKERQLELLALYNHIHEPLMIPKCQEIASTFSIENSINMYNNITAAETYAGMLKYNWRLPRSVPFSINEPAHAFEAMTLFNVLYSAKDYDTFYKTAVYLRDIINEGLYVYTLSVAIVYRKDTQGIQFPPIYETFPSYFFNGEIMTTAQRLNTHGSRLVNNYPSTFLWDDNVVIRWNTTVWPYLDQTSSLSYFTNDVGLNGAHYFMSVVNPFWLGDKLASVIHKAERGESWWYALRQLLSRYYMERLSNGLGEVPEITDIVKDGFNSGLMYFNGIPFPTRPNNFALNQPEFAETLEQIKAFEQRIWEAIDQGFYISKSGEKVNLLTDSGIQDLANLIESNADSPNRLYYKDFIRLWKKVLGNTIKSQVAYNNHFAPLVVPSALENQQTAIRDPAYYMILKRVMKLVWYWQKRMPLYKVEEMAVPDIVIEKVETDKLVTYFENTYTNITNHLYQSEAESKGIYDDVKVLVQRPRLNHKPFSIKVQVKSDVPKKVLIKFFLAPKYDSNGFEIPLHLNTENFFLLEQFPYDLPAGETVVTRKSTDFVYTAKEWPSPKEILDKIAKGEWSPARRTMNVFPHNLLLPKGKVGGMKFVLGVYIQEFDGYKPAYSSGFTTIGFPSNRPMYSYQMQHIKNFKLQDVTIYHKEVPEIQIPNNF